MKPENNGDKFTNEEDEFISEEAEELSYYDKLNLVILKNESGKSRATRIQKLGLILNSIREGKTPSSHGPYFYGGFSDDIEESLINLLESGLIKKEHGEYVLTSYGQKVIQYLEKLNDHEFIELTKIARDIMPRLRELKDRELVILTYILFPELAKHSLIKDESLQKEIQRVLKKQKLGPLKLFLVKDASANGG